MYSYDDNYANTGNLKLQYFEGLCSRHEFHNNNVHEYSNTGSIDSYNRYDNRAYFLPRDAL